MKIEMRGNSNIGRVRKNNEDSIFFDEKLGVSIVCDGIGGREGGEVASQITTENMKSEIHTWRAKSNDPVSFLKSAAQKTNTLIVNKGMEEPKLEGMGTTMECSLFHEGMLYLAHIGDSRTYFFFKDQFWQLTVDHNVKTLAEYGDIPKETMNMVGGDSLVKALGVSLRAEIDVYQMKLEPGQLFISASDGLFDMVEDKQIAESVRRHFSDSDLMTKDLIDLACKNGGVDNISLVVTRIM